MKRLILLTLALVLSGCASLHQMQTPYNPDDFILEKQAGTGKISGQAFLKTLGGDVKYGAGCTVFCLESTPYTDELYYAAERRQLIDERTLNPDFKLHARQVVANGEGEFTFPNLPAGKYYVYTTITWYITRYRQSGGGVQAEVNLGDGESKNIILTR